MTNSPLCNIPVIAYSATDIVNSALGDGRRLLLFGPPGVGKTTLVTTIAKTIHQAGSQCWCLSADPGSPGIGIPGAISLGQWIKGSWKLEDSQALCSLDAGRFRLPLVSAVRRLATQAGNGILLLDAPGVVRGMAGRELLAGLVEAAAIDAILVLTAKDQHVPLLDELLALSQQVFIVHAAAEATRPGKQVRAKRRTAQWEAYLADAMEYTFDIRNVHLVGAPPPVDAVESWTGRQIALQQGNQTLAMGEVLQLEANTLKVLLPRNSTLTDTLLIRDAARSQQGLLETAVPFTAEPLSYLPPADVIPMPLSGGPRIVGRVGHLDVSLLNGVFGDPQLHLRLRHQGRSLLFDLGDGVRLPARLAHQVSDAFISHAHMDHISGFSWLLRSRLGDFPPCRVYGPPGLAEHIHGFMKSFLWDRIADRGPVFMVNELHGEFLQRYRLQAGKVSYERLDDAKVINGIVHEELGFRIRAVVLDHHTPVIAYAYEPNQEINIRKDRLQARALTPGPWLAELKRQLLCGNRDALVPLPDGSQQPAGALGDELVFIKAGKKLVYATDFADSVENRARIIALARSAHTFFCEAPFLQCDQAQAEHTGHLTTQACGEIAQAAGVARLVPFHFSRRYEDNPQQIYDEINAVCQSLVAPQTFSVFTMPKSSGLDERQYFNDELDDQLDDQFDDIPST